MACLSCATEVKLTEADAVCLSSRIDDLVIEAEETDPVLVVLDCGLEETEVAGGGGDRAHAGPATPEIKTVAPAETGGEAAAPTFFILSRLQLTCLQETFSGGDGVLRYPLQEDFQGCGSANSNG